MIEIKAAHELDRMRRAGEIVSEVLEVLKEAARPGVTTQALDEIARARIVELGGKPAFKGYRGFPANLCVSVNEQVVHGIPSERRLVPGDIVGLDVGVLWEGYYADGAITVAVDGISPEASRLIEVTKQALFDGIAQALPSRRLSDISHAIQRRAEASGFSVVRDFVGHGIGRQLHEPPQIPNYGQPGFGPVLEEGMTLAIEPMINQGTYEVQVLADGWTAVTKDRKLSAHFEHTVVITSEEPEILTQCPKKRLSK